MDVFLSQGLSIGEWLKTSHLQLWRFGHDDQVIGFGEDFQRLCRVLAKKLNDLHTVIQFSGCIEEDEESFLNNILVHESYKIELKLHPGTDIYDGMLKDLKGFIKLIKYIGDNHRPEGMNLPIEYNQFFELVDEFKDLLNQTNLRPNMYNDFRDAELWIFNFPAFLESHEKFCIIEKLQKISDHKVFEKLNPEWVDVITHDDYYSTDEVINESSISDYDAANGKFAGFLKKFMYSKERPTAVAKYFQDFFPYAFGELHIGVYKYLPRRNEQFSLVCLLLESTSFIGGLAADSA
ncbi:hypothetical protein COLO4_31616 [Corchorus olitorius]|uniref:Uncharacterized protein n=1 Tax=Corchorus olitorius TaxID=93759 RepID=A0A1R3H3V8_9ROSI|nr:hypothetical protein COLO4_31616 [Corchorus olitorius]